MIQMMMMETGSGAATEERIAALEKKVREMEALVKGLTQELLDLKSITMKMSKQTDERSRQELRRTAPAAAPAPAAPAPATTGSTVIRPKGRAPETPPAPAEPEMDWIMQPDGTMKQEPRRGDKDYIVASASYAKKKGAAGKERQSDLIYATEESKKDPAKK
jgi:TolA-binding protein